MPAFTFTDTEPRYYSTLGVAAEPGVSVDFADSPPDDGRWSPAGSTSKPVQPALAADVPNPTEGS